MRKNFGAKTWLYPMPVLIVGEGRVDAKKLDPIIYDSVWHAYWRFGEKVGTAFADGKKIQ